MKMSMVRGPKAQVFDLAPVGRNTATELLNWLRHGRSVGWTLEPGDMTRYGLVLTPLGGMRDLCQAVGGGVGDGSEYILVTYTGGLEMGHGSQVVTQWCHHTHLMGSLTDNDHTARIVAGLVRMVWHLMAHPEVEPGEYTFDEDVRTAAMQEVMDGGA